jgi:hypothetical protein
MGGENESGKKGRNVEKLGKKIEGRKAEVLPNRQFETKTRISPNHRAEAKAEKRNITVSLIYRIKYKIYEEKRAEEEKEVEKKNAKRRLGCFIGERHLPQR